jgi:hypothetical protein
LVTAVLRPGKRPTGAENAMIMKRVLNLLRQHWPHTHILLRGYGYFSNPELMALILADGKADFKIAARVKQYKARVLLHLPSGCPVKGLLAQVCQPLPRNQDARYAALL